MSTNEPVGNAAVATEPPARLPSLHMRRADLLNLPPLDLPDGIVLRERQASNNAHLADLLQRAFPDQPWTIADVQHALVDDPSVLKTMLLVNEAGQIVATASVQDRPNSHPRTGTIHWVGSDPDLRGRRLGYFASLAVLHEFAKLGYDDADLFTDDHRVPAIKTYARLGFGVEYSHETHAARWDKLRDALAGYLEIA